MGLLTFRKKSQKGQKDSDSRASTFTIRPSMSIITTHLNPEEGHDADVPDTSVLTSLAECAGATSTAVEEYTPLEVSTAASDRRSMVSVASSGTASNSNPSSQSSHGVSKQRAPGRWQPETIEETDGDRLQTFTLPPTSWASAAEQEELDASRLAQLVGVSNDSPFGFETLGDKMGEPQSRGALNEVEDTDTDFYVPHFSRTNRNGGVR